MPAHLAEQRDLVGRQARCSHRLINGVGDAAPRFGSRVLDGHHACGVATQAREVRRRRDRSTRGCSPDLDGPGGAPTPRGRGAGTEIPARRAADHGTRAGRVVTGSVVTAGVTSTPRWRVQLRRAKRPPREPVRPADAALSGTSRHRPASAGRNSSVVGETGFAPATARPPAQHDGDALPARRPATRWDGPLAAGAVRQPHLGVFVHRLSADTPGGTHIRKSSGLQTDC